METSITGKTRRKTSMGSLWSEIKERTTAQALLAFGVTIISIIGVILLSWTILQTSDEGIIDRAQTIFNALLPVIGTWVGTILAFYFSRENLEAAFQNTQRLLSSQDKLRSTPVTKIMVPKNKLYFVDDQTKKLIDVLDELKNRKFRRLPVLDKAGAPLHMVYVDGIYDFLFRVNAGEPDKSKFDFDALSKYKPSVGEPDPKRPFAVVTEIATLADAKDAMDKIPECRDVFVVKDRLVEGYLTNNDITQNAIV